MLIKPTFQQITALHLVVHQPAWTDVNQILELELEQTLERLLNTSVTETVHELRGRAKMLTELLALTTGTRVLLEQMTKK